MPMLPSPLWEVNFLLFGLIFRILKGKSVQFNFTNKPFKVGYITGADMMIKKSVINEVGPFDSDFFMYYEETELSYRIEKAGYESHSVPEAKIIHLEGQSCDTSERRERMKNVSKKIYYSKTQSKFNYRLSSFLFKIYACLRLTLYKLIGNSKKYNYWNIVLDNL
jgi:GT2 family glycosyltransferase